MSEIADTETVLEIENLYAGYYKDLNIIQDICIKVRRNQITAILGAEWSRQINCTQSHFRIFASQCWRGFWREKVC